MKIFGGLLILAIVFLVMSRSGDNDIVGVYSSKTATGYEAVSLMYLKGYSPFLEVPDDYIKLKIERDSTFLYTINSKEYSGRWKVDGKTLILDHTDASKDDLELKVRNNKLYNISEVTLCNSKEKMMRLMLFRKK